MNWELVKSTHADNLKHDDVHFFFIRKSDEDQNWIQILLKAPQRCPEPILAPKSFMLCMGKVGNEMFDGDQMVGAAAVSAGDHGMVVCWGGETSAVWSCQWRLTTLHGVECGHQQQAGLQSVGWTVEMVNSQ